MTVSSQSFIPRPHYDRLLAETLDTPSIKVLTGIRRCGKSTLLKILVKALLEDGVPQQSILYRKLDSYDVPLEPDATWLDGLLADALTARDASAPLYVFLDEIQQVDGWERPIRRLYESSAARIYLTGSNAFLLSSDLATYLSGRYVEIPVFPLSFREYLSFAAAFGGQAESDLDEVALFSCYLRFGGMPGLFAAAAFTEESATRELSAIRDTVLLNDVAKRFNVRDIDLLEKLLRYTYSTSGNLFSANRVAGALTSMGKKTSVDTVDAYLGALRSAFALYECQQAGLKGKEVLRPRRKYYAPDGGLRNLETGFSMQDIGFQLEGVVFMDLRRRGYEVSVGALPAGEIDFVARRRSEKLYVQVCETLLDEATRSREVAPLDAVGDSYPKMILTRDDASVGITPSGVRIVSLQQWLLEDQDA